MRKILLTLASLLSIVGIAWAANQVVVKPYREIGAVELVPSGDRVGLSISSTQVANNTTAIVVKGSAGQLYGIRAFNNSGTIAYIKLYNATSGTCGSGTPVDRAMIPANTSGAGFIWFNAIGEAYGTGLTMCITGAYADADTTAPAASTYLVTVLYK